MLQHETNVNRW